MSTGSFRLSIGRVTLRVDSPLVELSSALSLLYPRYQTSVSGGDYDFDVAIVPGSTFRRWFRKNATFCFSGQAPFQPMALDHAHALFEWGVNWAIGTHVQRHLILHSAVLEKSGKGLMLAAMSGSGKSTLAAELVLQGWRLLSDELALIDGPSLELVPHPRPISLKNASIEVIRARHMKAVFGPVARHTHKGTVVHLRVPDTSVDRALETVRPTMIVFPRWSAGSSLKILPVGSGDAAMRLIDQSFNYPVLGRLGFERLADLVASAEAWEIEYSSLDDAVQALDDLIAANG